MPTAAESALWNSLHNRHTNTANDIARIWKQCSDQTLDRITVSPVQLSVSSEGIIWVDSLNPSVFQLLMSDE